MTTEEKKDLELLAKAAAIFTPETLQGLYHGVIWLEPEEEEIVKQAREVALKYVC